MKRVFAVEDLLSHVTQLLMNNHLNR